MDHRRSGVSSRQVLVTLTLVAVIMAVVGAIRFIRYSEAAAGDPNLIAVAPFDLPDDPGELLSWRVGLATGLTTRLAADARFETVPQAEIANLWRASETPIISAVEVARRTGAGFGVYGRVEATPGDSLLLRAAVLDAFRAVGMFEVARQLPRESTLEAAVDTLATALLSQWERP